MILKEKLEKKCVNVLEQCPAKKEESGLKNLRLKTKCTKKSEKIVEKNVEPFLVNIQKWIGLVDFKEHHVLQWLLVAILLVCTTNSFAQECEAFQSLEQAQLELSLRQYECNEVYSGGSTWNGRVDSATSTFPINCNGGTVNEGYVLLYMCDFCTSADYQLSLYEDTLDCNRECKQSGRYCAFSGGWGSTLNGPTYPTCGRVDSTLVGCREEESSSSVAISSSSSSDSTVISSSSGGGGGEEESSSSGEPINPGDDEEDGGFICNYYSPVEPFETTDLCFQSEFIGTQFYKPPTQVGGYNAIKDSIWIMCDYNEVIFHSYTGRIRLNSEYQQKKYCYTNSMCLSDVEYVVNVGEFYDCVYPGGKIGVGCPIPVPSEELGIDYFLFFVGSDGRLYYDSNNGSFFMPSNISLNELLNGKYDVYGNEDFPRVGLVGSQVSLQDAYNICDSIWNYENDVPPSDTGSIPETYSSSSTTQPPILSSSSVGGDSPGGGSSSPGGDSPSSSGSGSGIPGGGITNGTGGRDTTTAEQLMSSFIDAYSFSDLDTSGTEGNFALREDVWRLYELLKDGLTMVKDGLGNLLGFGTALVENTDTLRHDLKLSLINDSTAISYEISIDSLLRIIANSPIKFDSSYQETYDNGWSAVQRWMQNTIRTDALGGSGGTVDSSWSLAVVDSSNNVIAQTTLNFLDSALYAHYSALMGISGSNGAIASLAGNIYTTQQSISGSNSAIASAVSQTAYGTLPIIQSRVDSAAKMLTAIKAATADNSNYMTAMGYVAQGLSNQLSSLNSATNSNINANFNGLHDHLSSMQSQLDANNRNLITAIGGLGGGLDSGFGGLSTLLDTNLNVKGSPGDTAGVGSAWGSIEGNATTESEDVVGWLHGLVSGDSAFGTSYDSIFPGYDSLGVPDSVFAGYDSSSLVNALDSMNNADSAAFVKSLDMYFDSLKNDFKLVAFDSLILDDLGAKVPNTNTCPEHCFRGVIQSSDNRINGIKYDFDLCHKWILNMDVFQFLRLIFRLFVSVTCIFIGMWCVVGRSNYG